MLNLRPAIAGDTPAIWGLIDDFKHTFLTDYYQATPETAKAIIDTGEALVIEAFDYPVGAVWYNDQDHDLHISLHLIVRPEFMRQFLREKLAHLIIDHGFNRYKVGKIKAYCLKKQTTAKSLALRYGFKKRGYFPRETRQDGKYSDLTIYELVKHDWRHYKKYPSKHKPKKPTQFVETEKETDTNNISSTISP